MAQNASARDAVCHGAELPYVFNSPGFAQDAFDEKQKALSANLETLWGAFAKDPFKAPNDGWQPFRSKQQFLELEGAGPYGMVGVPKTAHCDFWDSIGYDLRGAGFPLGRTFSAGAGFSPVSD